MQDTPVQDNDSCPACGGTVILHDAVQGIAKCRTCSHRFTAEEYVFYLDEETARIPKSMTDEADDMDDESDEAEMVEESPETDSDD